MPWGAWPHPFTSVFAKARDELNHLVNPSKVKLFAFGADARKLYFQFSFVEHADHLRFGELKDHFESTQRRAGGARSANAPKELIDIRFSLIHVCEKLVTGCWEPAAEAALMMLAAKQFGAEAVERELRRLRTDGHWWRRAMRDEWDHRASRPGPLPDSSVRYPKETAENAEEAYANRVTEFMADDIKGRNVVEIGPGTGRISARLVRIAAKLTCVEPILAMIAKLNARLGPDLSAKVELANAFAQDFLKRSSAHFDVAVCSRVLMHNVGDEEFNELVRLLCNTSQIVYVLEDVTQDRRSGPATALRTETDLKEAFSRWKFEPDLRSDYSLFEDQFVFLRFRPGSTAAAGVRDHSRAV
jgi:SAM-dependent methyltransferase